MKISFIERERTCSSHQHTAYTYQATPPDIGLDMLLQNHLNLKRKG